MGQHYEPIMICLFLKCGFVAAGPETGHSYSLSNVKVSVSPSLSSVVLGLGTRECCEPASSVTITG